VSRLQIARVSSASPSPNAVPSHPLRAIYCASTATQAAPFSDLLRIYCNAGYPIKRQLAAGYALYVLPSALNAGWLGLATCLGIMQARHCPGEAAGRMLNELHHMFLVLWGGSLLWCNLSARE
jgi:hypothetical protein